LALLVANDKKGGAGTKRRAALPPSLYSEVVAPFLHFDAPLPDQLYVLGGRNEQQEALDVVEMFDTWHGRWVSCPSMPVKRAGCACALLPDGRRLLVAGGYDERGIVAGLLATCNVFNPEDQSWSSRCADLGMARWGHGCAALGGRVFAVGGCALRAGSPLSEDLMETLRSCEVYNPSGDVWEPCASLNVARAGARLVALGEERLAAVGGCDDVFGRAEMLTSVELYHIETGTWALLDAQLSVPRTTAAAAALDDRRILVMGGAPSLASVETYRMPAGKRARSSPGNGGIAATAAAGACGAVEPQSAEEEDDDDDDPMPAPVRDMEEGRMGCQAVAMRLPAAAGSYPLCNRWCVVVVGGENGQDWDDSQAAVRQFSSVLVYDTEAAKWRPEGSFPNIPTPRTAMALCVAPGQVAGHL
jgi:N-acetylneuraminic acid mutarotase